MRGYRWLLAVMVLGGLTLLLLKCRDDGSVQKGEIALARQAAIQGLNETARRLVADSTRWSIHPERYAFRNVSLGKAHYSTEVSAPYRSVTSENGYAVDTANVVSTAALNDGESHRIDATYVRTCGRDMGIRLVNFSER